MDRRRSGSPHGQRRPVKAAVCWRNRSVLSDDECRT
jgi:hypothetical protein